MPNILLNTVLEMYFFLLFIESKTKQYLVYAGRPFSDIKFKNENGLNYLHYHFLATP